MSKCVIAIQARLASIRLPRKILMDVGGKPMISQIHRRCSAVQNADAVVIACPEDDRIDIGKETLLTTVGGPEVDVMTRLLNVAKEYKADKLVRVTGDCPLIPPDMIRHMIDQAQKYPTADVIQNWKPRCHPDGFDCEVWDVSYLKYLSDELHNEADREWFAQFALEHGAQSKHVDCGGQDLSMIRLTCDYPEDLELIRAIYKDMGNEVWGADLILRWCFQHPKLMRKNAHHRAKGNFGSRPIK